MKNGNFLSLVGVENKKLWKRVSTKIVIIILVVLSVGMIGLTKLAEKMTASLVKKDTSTSQKVDWKDQLTAGNVSLEAAIKKAEDSDTYQEKLGLDQMKKSLSENKYRLENNIEPLTDDSKFNYWYNLGDMNMWQFIALFVIIATSSLVAGEFSENTMKTMVSRPYTRGQLLGAKFVSTTLFALLMTIIGFVTVALSLLAFYGSDCIFINQLMWFGGKTVEISGFGFTMVLLAFNFITSLIFIYFAFFLAAISRSRAVATGISIAVLFGSAFLTLLPQKFEWGKYIYLSLSDLTGFITYGDPYYNVGLSFSTIYCCACTLVLIIVSFITFKKRDIN